MLKKLLLDAIRSAEEALAQAEDLGDADAVCRAYARYTEAKENYRALTGNDRRPAGTAALQPA